MDGMTETTLDSGSVRSVRQTVLAMLGLCFVLMLVALDQTVIGTALPTVVSELKGFDLYAWVGTAYLLTSVITVPIFGKLGDEHGRKPFVLVGILLFTVASMSCGLAQNMIELVLARGLQGVGGGILVATTFACIPDLFPDTHARLKWQVMFSTSFGIANAIGPTLGGYLTQYFGWRSVFFVNLPVGLLSLMFVSRYLPRIRHSPHPPSPLDWVGASLIGLTLGTLQLLVEWWPQHKPAEWLWALGGVSLMTVLALIWWEPRVRNPILPTAMLRDATLRRLFLLSLAMGFGMFSVMYYAPLLYQGGLGLSPKEAGLLITPFAVCITVGSIANGRMVTRIPHPNWMLYLGVALFGLATWLLSQQDQHSPRSTIMLTMGMGGIGIGVMLPNLTLFTQASAHRTQLGIATATLQSMRMIGSMLGTAISGVLITHRYKAEVTHALSQMGQGQWVDRFADPQVLVNHSSMGAGVPDADMITVARSSLISAVHQSHWMVVVLMMLLGLSLFWLPPLSLKPSTQQA
ncbi:MAG TPA: MFS transporter [Aquabacterium sp.]|nr:MFS transporter [Aquabacterium sp.]